MARPSATAALLLVLSLLAVAQCRTVAVAADNAAEPESTAAVAVSDENGLSSNPTLPTADAGASATATEEEEVLPAEQQHGIEFLRLPSHRLHRHHPCRLHQHLWWKRHHGVYHDAPRRFHYSGHGERREAVSHLAILPGAEAREEEEAKPVAEPDPDRSLPDSDGEGKPVAIREPSFAEADGHDDERAGAAVRAWKKEMLRRWFQFHFHHGMRRHRHRHRLHHVHHDDEEGHEEQKEQEAAPEGMNMKRFHFHHHDEEDEEKNMMGKRLWFRHAAEHGEDSDDEDEQVEEMVRRFRKAIMRRRFGHGHGHGRRFFHHDHRHRHGEEEVAEKQADGEEESGVIGWIKGLMNRF